MSDAGAVALAVAVWIGAFLAVPAPAWVGVVGVALALGLRRPNLLVVAAGVLAGSLAVASWSGLDPPRPATVRGESVLAGDPVDVGTSVRVDLRFGGRRVEAWARGSAATALGRRLAGEVVVVEGRLRAPPDGARTRLAVRHVAARLDVEAVEPEWRHGSTMARAANAVRRALVDGTGSLTNDRRALLTGFLIGDDRDLPASIEADFRASGLTHLLAVSGSNVAATLAIVGPGLRRLQLRGRLLASLAVIGFFAVMTRAEPSVLRASTMAAIACWAAFAGRPVSRLRVLALAVAGLVLVDPMLVRSVGFQLSVGASIGLALLALPIATRIPGPRWLAESLGVTLAAQAGVAPVLLSTFGGMPVVTVFANLLAVPVAGPLTAWGLTAGLAAGIVGGGVASLLHAPTDLMVGWIAGVARVAARVPLGVVDGRDLLVVAVVAVSLVRFRRVAVVASMAVVLALARPASGAVVDGELARGAHLWRDGGTVLVLDGDTDAGRLLEGLHRAGVRKLDLVVARRGSPAIGGVLLQVHARVVVGAVAAPAGHRIRGATAVDRPLDLRIGRLLVRLRPGGAALDVDIGETAGRGAVAR